MRRLLKSHASSYGVVIPSILLRREAFNSQMRLPWSSSGNFFPRERVSP